MKKSPLYVGLVHYPIYDKNFNVITTAITNYDLHDISRSAKTYGIKKYFIIHHVPGQLDMVRKIMGFWESDTGRNYNGYRTQAFDIVDIRPSIEAAVDAVTEVEAKSLISSRPMRGPIPIPFPIRPCAKSGKKRTRRFSCSSVRVMG